MMRMQMSPAAAGLLRALIVRSGAERNRILLTEVRSVDWQSLTFTGERHQLALRITGGDSIAVSERMCAGIEDCKFSIAGLIVADIARVGTPRRAPDGATEIVIEALTISDQRMERRSSARAWCSASAASADCTADAWPSRCRSIREIISSGDGIAAGSNR